MIGASAVLAIALGLVVAQHTGLIGQAPTLFALGLLNIVVGGAIFWFHGGSRITAAGLFGLACVVFVGVSAVWWTIQSGPVETESSDVAAASVCCLVLMWAAFWRQPPTHAPRRPLSASRAVSQTGMLLAIPLVLVTAVGTRWSYGVSSSVPVHICLGCFTLLMVSVQVHLASLGDSRRLIVVQGACAVGIVGLMAFTVFTGYGRLNLVALGMAGLLVISGQSARIWVKAATLVAVGPALLVLSLARQIWFEHKYGVTTNGAMSVFTPLRDCARLIDRVSAGVVHLDFGQSMLAPLVFWIPRALWADKPVSLGAHIGSLLGYSGPEGQTWSAMFLGDFFLALGWWSLPIVIVVVGVLIKLLDAWWARQWSASGRDVTWLLRTTLVVVLVSDVPDYFWGGSFNYISRCVLRVTPILGLLACIWLSRGLRRWAGELSSRTPSAQRDDVTNSREPRRGIRPHRSP